MRAIDADKFKDNILSGLYVFCQENKEDIARAIDDEPTINVVINERPQGKWISTYKSRSFCNPGKICSLCGKVVEFSENYCPACGAKMKCDT